MDHQVADLRSLARTAVEGFARRQTMYVGAFAISAYFLDPLQSALGFIFCFAADVVLVLISSRICRTAENEDFPYKFYHTAVLAVTIASALAIAHFSIRISLLEGPGNHVISVFFVLAAALYASMNIVEIAEILWIRLGVYSATLIGIPLFDVITTRPGPTSLLWAEVATMAFVIYLLFASAFFFRDRYRKDLAHLEAVEHAQVLANSANRTKSEFLANMSHELRTPMNGVMGMLEAAIRSDLPEAQRHQLEIAHHSAKNLLRLLNDIVDISRLEAGEIKMEISDFSPRDLVEEVASLLGPRAEEKGLRLTCYVDSGVPDRLRADPVRIEQVLLNLVGNALKFTDEGRISVGVRMAGGTATPALLFDVADTGIGIAPELAPYLFKRFARADTSTTRRFAGAGLGLSISRQLVDLMGGTIDLDSVEGEGSTFRFSVPVRKAPGSDRAVDPVTGAGAIASGGDRPLRILVAEDHAINKIVMEEMFWGTGHAIRIVDNGAQALSALDDQPFDLVLMDMEMPVMGGIEATRAIRARAGPERGVPIIALTANAMAGDREAYLAEGITDHVTKPIDRTTLFTAIRRATAGRRSAARGISTERQRTRTS